MRARSKGISFFSTGKLALHSAGSLFASENFSCAEEDYSACMLCKAEQTLLRL